MYDILNGINGVEDVKKLSSEELTLLAEDIREALFHRLTKIGGHFGSNFGIVEAEIALHYVFSSPRDKIVFDVSHQTYPHKMLTGRRLGYTDETRFCEDSGYSNPEESEHDLFNVGHTSTSISLATGLAKARDLNGENYNVIALIGDGSLSGGLALEGLSVAASELSSNLIIIVNDNQQSISETHGGIYDNLRLLRETKGTAPLNMFRAWGLDYLYEENGNDISSLIALFKKVKDIDHPIVVHINTVKGKGYARAEKNREAWHWMLPFNRETGLSSAPPRGGYYPGIIKNYLVEKARRDEKVVLVTPNMPGSIGLSPEERGSLGKRYIDVGIAEEQAVTMASGLAKGGLKPLVFTNMTFLQRAYDQVSHDVCINGTHVTFLLAYSSFVGLTDVTHLGIFGLPIFLNIPNLIVLAPTCPNELIEMTEWVLDKSTHPTMILIPGGEVYPRDVHFSGDLGYKIARKGEKLAIVAAGDFFRRGEILADEVQKRFGFSPTLVDPKDLASLDEKTLRDLENDHEVIVSLEDGVLDGGFGEKLAAFYGTSDIKFKAYGLKKRFYDRYDPEKLLVSLGADVQSVLNDLAVLFEKT